MSANITAAVTDKHTIAPAWWEISFDIPDFPAGLLPGQFFSLRCEPCFLRRAIFPQQLGGSRFSLLLRPSADAGQAWLIARQPGDRLDLLGPFGSGYRLPGHARNLLLVSDGRQLSPLLFQMELAAATGCAVTLAHGASRAAKLLPVTRLPAAVEFHAATLDGSQGRRGGLDGLLPGLLRWADAVLAVGSSTLYQTLKRQARQERLVLTRNFLHGLVAPALLPCGTGACFACAIAGARGPQLACVDGPVFDLTDINLGQGDD